MRRWIAVCVCLLCLLTPALGQAAEELLPEGALTGRVLPGGWFEEAWYTGAENYTIEPAGENGVRIHCPVDNDARLCYTLQVKENSYYTLSCDVKVQGVENGAGANISVTDAVAASAPRYGTADWQRISLTGKTGEGQTSLTVCVRLGGYGALSKGEAWFKNVSVTESERLADAVPFSMAVMEEEEDYQAGKVPYFGAMLLVCLLCAVGFFAVERNVISRKGPKAAEKARPWRLPVLLLGAFLLRVVLSLAVYGHSTDIQCFMAWGNAIANNGISSFYTSGMFADYPPGYMYVLGATSTLGELLGLTYGSDGYVLLTKAPAILADIASAYIVYRLARRRFGEDTALWLAAVVAFNPVMAFVSGGWGQIDAVLTLLLLWTLWLFLEDRRILAGAVYGLAILMKPQALMLGPLLAAAYLVQVRSLKDAARTLGAVAAAFGVLLLLSLPFRSTQGPLWLLDKYFSTATSYPYASVEAFNLMALIGGNWKRVESVPFLFSYGVWGTALMAIFLGLTIWLYLKNRAREGVLWLCAGYALCALFILGQYMHERYLFPALLLLLLAFVEMGDKRLFRAYGMLSVSLLLNVLAAFVIVDHPECRGAQYEALTFVGSLLNVGGFGYLTWVVADMLLKNRACPAFTKERPAPALPQAEQRETAFTFTKRDRLLCCGLTAVYALVALFNLGTCNSPETAWQARLGESATVRLESAEDVAAVWLFGGIAEGSLEIRTGDGNAVAYSQIYDDMYRWILLQLPAHTDTLTLTVTGGGVCLNEVALKDADNRLLAASSDVAALTDEQDAVPERPSYYTNMYFDELYHGRTAYEHLHGLEPYENSHPPLGKVFIMAGIAVFGMAPFGWRVSGALLGVAMLPILYVFAKRLFKKSEYALLSAGLFALDFMHFTQTRIATIDVYAVFFILLMYDFMYQYCCMDFFRDGLKKTLKPLALAGVFFGMGAASKWTCIYAGGGLAILFFATLFQRYRESKALKASRRAEDREKGAQFGRYAALTLLWCCLFYILVPVVVYLLSYIPYYLCEKHYDLKGVWGVQEFMYTYHSTLKDVHPYQSAWWQWPLDIRPTWYYVGYNASGTRAGTISAFGNPAVWWVCSAGLVGLIIRLVRGNIRYEKGMGVLLVGAAANYLPWVLVPRCTFTYHYFPMVPFIILSTVYLVRDMEWRKPERAWWKWGWMALCALLFVLFYPVISGVEVPIWYIRALEWLPSWTFLGY